MSILGKRKLPRREIPWLTTLLDKMSYSKLPTCSVVIRRLMFEVERGYPLCSATHTIKKELLDLWGYAGYGDILLQPKHIVTKIRALHDSYKTLVKQPTARRETPSFKKKEALFLDSLQTLFDITVKSLVSSNLITSVDRDFLINHWSKTISTTRDFTTKAAVETKLARQERYRQFSSAQSSLTSTPRAAPIPSPSSSTSGSPVDDSPDFTPTPKQQCNSSGTTLHLSKDIVRKVGYNISNFIKVVPSQSYCPNSKYQFSKNQFLKYYL